jgi:hypothetical protein
LTDAKITQLPAATVPLAGTEKAEIVQGGVNKQVDVSEFGGGGSGTVESVTGNGVNNTDPDNPVVRSADASNEGTTKLYTTTGSNTDGTMDQNSITNQLALKAPLASPAFTGTPTAPTASVGTDDTQIASTAYVVNEIASRSPKVLVIAASDEITPITAAANKITFRMPYAMTLTAVRASLTTTQTSGSIFTIDIHESGTTILSTKITIDNGETTSTTAVTPPVISDSTLADDAVITIDVDQIGDGTAKGLKISLIGS